MKIIYVCEECGRHFGEEKECRLHEQSCSDTIRTVAWVTPPGREPLRVRWLENRRRAEDVALALCRIRKRDRDSCERIDHREGGA